jgi:tetratricopeptide (TPR) repeat protein
MLGEYQEELEVARRGSQSVPDHAQLVRAQARALIALGRSAEGLELLEHQLTRMDPGRDPTALFDSTARELDAHGYPEAAQALWERLLAWYSTRPAEETTGAEHRRARANLLLQLDRLLEASVLVESLAWDFTDSASDQGRLGVFRAKLGDAAGAEAVSEALLRWDAPYPMGRNTLWAAYISAQLGELDRAVHLLRDASQQGWNYRDRLHSDPFLRPLRDHPAFQELIRPKG